jgi:hypothetical protein
MAAGVSGSALALHGRLDLESLRTPEPSAKTGALERGGVAREARRLGHALALTQGQREGPVEDIAGS